MKKKIDVGDLRKGMYISELDRPWKETHFLFQGFELDDDSILAEIRHLCDYVYIETNHVSGGGSPRPTGRPNISVNVESESTGRRVPVPDPGQARKTPPIKKRWRPETTTLEQELPRAREIKSETRNVLYQTLEDVRLGRTIDSAATKAVIANMVESIISNPDAMGVLSQLKSIDEYTALHSVRVCILALTFGRHMDMTREELNLLGVGALLHDVGKMKVPTEIINKQGKLTDKEFEIIKTHVPLGVEVLEKSPGILPISIAVAANHHERYGGGGYASGIKGDNIGEFGMIAGIVDCYDAITSDRTYHKGMTAYEALSKMYQWRTSAFHPGLVEQFIQCMGVYPIGSLVELTTGAIGVVATVNRERRLKPRVALILNPDKQRYESVKIVDLMQEAIDRPRGAPEIRKVIPAGEHGISPMDYLPLIDNPAGI
ncbi:MAG: HD-GYP domain-containing protein [Acidiferrobacterales bacterium]